MKHLRRCLFNGLTAISLLLCVTTIAICIHSYFAMDQILYASWPTSQMQRTRAIFSMGGTIAWQQTTFQARNPYRFDTSDTTGWYLISLPRSTNPKMKNGYPFAPFNWQFH